VKTTVTRGDLNKALGLIGKAAALVHHGAEHVLLQAERDKLIVTARWRGTAELQLEVPTQTSEPGEVFLERKALADLVRSLSAYSFLQLSTTGQQELRVHAGATDALLSTVEDYDMPPALTWPAFTDEMVLDADFARAVSRTVVAVSHDVSRVGLRGLCIERAGCTSSTRAGLVATDGSRLLHATVGQADGGDHPAWPGLILPRWVAQLVAGFAPGKATLTCAENAGQVVIGSQRLVFYVEDTQREWVENWRQVLDHSAPEAFRTGRDPLLVALKRCARFASDVNKTVQASIEDGKLHLRCTRVFETLDEDVEVEVLNGLGTTGANAKLWAEALEATTTEVVTFRQGSDSMAPISWATAGDDLPDCAVLMPVRLD